MSDLAVFDTNVFIYTDDSSARQSSGRAIELHRFRRISFCDALIIHAARTVGTSVLFSEDLQAESVCGKLRVVNPFDGL